jgi:hypothetical protein
MKMLPIAFASIVVSALHGASAEEGEIKWSAVQWAGPQRDCGVGAMNNRWTIVVKNGVLSATSDARGSFHFNTRHLNRDGSGRVTFNDNLGKPMWIELEAGHGPRKIHYNSGYHTCVWLLDPNP